MKVMQLLSSLKHDDAERGIYHITHTLLKQNNDCIVVACADDDDDLVVKLTQEGCIYHRLPMPKKSWWSLRQIIRLTRLIKIHKPDIIHIHSRTPAWVLHWSLKLLSHQNRKQDKLSNTSYYPKVVSSMYGFYALNSYSQALFDADVMIVASKSIERYLTKALRQLHNSDSVPFLSKIVCVRRGVDVRLYPYRHNPSVHWLQHIFAEFPELEHKKWLIFPTKIGDEYGQEWLIDIIGNLKDKFPKIHIIIMDNDTSEGLKHAEAVIYNDFRQRLTALDLDKFVSFVGANPIDLKDWLSSANLVLALANRPQSIGMTALQAIHLGTPVLGWDKGAFGDILGNLYPLGLIKDTTAHALCQAIMRQLDAGTRPVITSDYEIDTMAHQTIEVYKNTLAQPA